MTMYTVLTVVLGHVKTIYMNVSYLMQVVCILFISQVWP